MKDETAKTIASTEITSFRYKSLGSWMEYIVSGIDTKIEDKGKYLHVENAYRLKRVQFKNRKVNKKLEYVLFKEPTAILIEKNRWNMEDKTIELPKNTEIMSGYVLR